MVNSSPETLALIASMLLNCMSGYFAASCCLMPSAATLAFTPLMDWNRNCARWGSVKICTCGSWAPMCARSDVRRLSPSGVPITMSILVPPWKSVPKFRPLTPSETPLATISSMDRTAANGASLTKSKLKWCGMLRISGQRMGRYPRSEAVWAWRFGTTSREEPG